MPKKETKQPEETKQPKVQMFTISFDTEKSSLSFIGNISAVQAEELLKLIIQQQQREELRKEVVSEMAAQEKIQEVKDKPK